MCRLGMLSDAVLFLAEVVLVVVLYRLFEPVSRTLSLAAIIGAAAWIGEIPFFLWLLFKRVDEQQWHERATTAS